MKRALAVLAVLALAAGAWAADRVYYNKVSASQTVSNVTLTANTKTILLINDGANEIYYDLYNDSETPADATTSSKELKSGETISFTFQPNSSSGLPGGSYYKTLSIICAAGETATVRVVAK